ncbi:ankyrin repeat and SOCS box protein 1 isoform X1 [Trachypithecus francoisi]|uniref:ankyrin repeat and SOCS box protein 1 isoform X1 n=1 Tax=Trachypithecus francoisi TaxID=54180 RepID=UPI00141B5C38|nr:ankyrin repeat and SOCS box protein 1 isoform X1 [Trachypithecus francoisi]
MRGSHSVAGILRVGYWRSPSQTSRPASTRLGSEAGNGGAAPARPRKLVRPARARRKPRPRRGPLALGAGSGRGPLSFLPAGRARARGGRGGRSTHGGGRQPRRAGRAGLRSAGRNLKEWLREQFCDHPLEHCEDTRLHDAAYVGDLQTLRSLLQEESYRSRINEKSVWCCGWLPCTPLRIAATAGHGNCVDFLIRKGAEVDLVDVKGQTALYVAVVNGHLESTQILLEAGADPNGSRHHRSTPVYHASRVGRADILKALIRYGADVDVNHHLTPDVQPRFSRRLTSLVVCPLYISAAYHNLQCFRLLLLAGANPDFNCNGPVNTQGFYRGSPGCVMDAVLRHGCEAAFVSLLVEFGANLNLVKWESLGPESRGRRKVDPEALQVFKEARSVPRTLLCLCRVAVRRALGKNRLHLIPSLPLPDPIKKFLLHE